MVGCRGRHGKGFGIGHPVRCFQSSSLQDPGFCRQVQPERAAQHLDGATRLLLAGSPGQDVEDLSEVDPAA